MPPRRMSHPSRTGKPAPNTKAPAGSYALPGGGPGGADAYPINNPGRAHAALAYVEQHGTPEEKAKVRGAVKRKYPDLPSSKGEGDSAAAKAAKPASSASKKARPARKS
jgi:hypothetical protein